MAIDTQMTSGTRETPMIEVSGLCNDLLILCGTPVVKNKVLSGLF